MGSIAPYSGVLINESHYREFTIDHQEASDFRKNLDEYVRCNPPPLIAPGETGIFVKGFVLGVIAALLGVVVIH